jgi:hypothetical protein
MQNVIGNIAAISAVFQFGFGNGCFGALPIQCHDLFIVHMPVSFLCDKASHPNTQIPGAVGYISFEKFLGKTGKSPSK